MRAPLLAALAALAALLCCCCCSCTPAAAQVLYVTTDQNINSTWTTVYVGKDSSLSGTYSPTVNVLGGAAIGTTWTFNSSHTTISDGTSNTVNFGETSTVRLAGAGASVGTFNGSGFGHADISDGTSNTILLGENSTANISGGNNLQQIGLSGHAHAGISDGTSNTIVVGENASCDIGGGTNNLLQVGNDGSVRFINGTTSGIRVGDDGSVRFIGGTVTGDLLGDDGSVAFIGGGNVTGAIHLRGNALADITDGTSNTVVFGENSDVDLRGGSTGAIYSVGNGTLHLYAESYSLTNPTPGAYDIYTGTYWTLMADFGPNLLILPYFEAQSDVTGNVYHPRFQFTAVPEPGPVALLAALAACALPAARRWRR